MQYVMSPMAVQAMQEESGELISAGSITMMQGLGLAVTQVTDVLVDRQAVMDLDCAMAAYKLDDLQTSPEAWGRAGRCICDKSRARVGGSYWAVG